MVIKICKKIKLFYGLIFYKVKNENSGKYFFNKMSIKDKIVQKNVNDRQKKTKKCHLNKSYTNKTDGTDRKYNMRIL